LPAVVEAEDRLVSEWLATNEPTRCPPRFADVACSAASDEAPKNAGDVPKRRRGRPPSIAAAQAVYEGGRRRRETETETNPNLELENI
jgi:hypothetical protein